MNISSFESLHNVLNKCKVILLRNPVAIKVFMAICSILLGMGLLVSKVNDYYFILAQILPLKVWGMLFLTVGSLNLTFVKTHPPGMIGVLIGIISLFLWILLNIATLQSPGYTPINVLLHLTILSETWVFVHTLLPHKSRFSQHNNDYGINTGSV